MSAGGALSPEDSPNRGGLEVPQKRVSRTTSKTKSPYKIGDGGLRPPELPSLVVSLRVDPVSTHIHIDQEPLLKTLVNLRDYIKLTNDNTQSSLRKELESEVGVVRRDLQISIQEAILDTEKRIEDKLEKNTEELKLALEEVAGIKSKVEKLQKQAQRAFQVDPNAGTGNPLGRDFELERDRLVLPPSKQSPSASRTSSKRATTGVVTSSRTMGDLAQFADTDTGISPDTLGARSKTDPNLGEPSPSTASTAASTAQNPLGRTPGSPSDMEHKRASAPALSSVPALADVPEPAAAPPSRPAPAPALVAAPQPVAQQQPAKNVDGPPAANSATVAKMEKEQASLSKESQRLKQDIAELQNKIEVFTKQNALLEGKLDSEMAAMQLNFDKAEEVSRAIRVKVVNLETRAEEEEIMLEKQQGHMSRLEILIGKLDEAKANQSAFQRLIEEVQNFAETKEQANQVPMLEIRINQLEHNMDSLTESSLRTDRELSTISKGVGDLSSKVDSHSAEIDKCIGRLEVTRRFDELEDNSRGMEDAILETRGHLSDLSVAIDSLAGKADKEDVLNLQGEMGNIAKGLKDKEQAVLFGARCLSCNRVFDDVQRESDTVDLHVEKNRTKFLAEVEKMIQNPDADVLKAVKMFAVKVGRPMSVPGSSGRGIFEGRDARSLAHGLDDVALVPLRGHSVAPETNTSRVLATAARPPGSASVGSSPRRRRRGADGQDASRTQTSYVPSSNTGAPKDGPMDFKHPLNHLVGSGL